MTLQIAIIGLNKIGASMGLVFSKSSHNLHCVGYDGEPHIGKAAEKLRAVEQSYLSLPRCIRRSSVVILTNPVDEVRLTLEVIADHASPGTVVIDTSPIKGEVSNWVQAILPEGIYFTGWTLALNPEHLHSSELGIGAAAADLFENSLIGITDPPGTPGKVLTLSSDLITVLGATPFFIGDIEADGLIAMGHELPRVAAIALLLATVDSSGWHEARKLAGPDYAKATLPVLSVPERDELGMSMIFNRENIMRLIDDLIRSLIRLRGHLEASDASSLKDDLERTIHERIAWLEARKKMSWDVQKQASSTPFKRRSVLGNWLQSKINQGKDGS